MSTATSIPSRPLCFGGSFNPIHNGHLQCAAAVARLGNFGAVVLIPTAQPPHKPLNSELASAKDRLAMSKLAADYQNAAEPSVRFIVDDLELARTGPSYTLDTARELRRRGFDDICWLIGADMLNYLPKWHEPLALLREVHFLIMQRPGTQLEWDSLPPAYQQLRQNVVSAPLVDVSATEIRRRVRAGESIDHLTPPPVARYIAQHGLYLA